VGVDAEYDPAVGRVSLQPQEIRRVFVNVMNNALYAAEQKRRTAGPDYVPRVTVRTADRGDRVEVRIRDNGTGIPEQARGRVFEPFFTTKPAGHGVGLGLSISHDIVVGGHGGEMRVESEPGAGAEMIITLPRHAPAA